VPVDLAGHSPQTTTLEKWGGWALPGALLVIVVCLVSFTRADPDLWGHIRFGDDILDQRSLHTVDPYSFTADRPWVNHEWLSEVLMALAHRVGGSAGLVLLKLAMIAGSVLCLISIARRDGADARGLVLIAAVGLAGTLTRTQSVRPQLFSVLFFSLLILLLRRAERKPTMLLLAFPIFVLWANTHGGWLVGCGTVVVWCALDALAHRSDRRRVALTALAGATAIAATPLTPYGFEIWGFLRETVGPSRRFISEWEWITGSPATLLPWLACWLLLVAAVLRSKQQPSLASLAIPVMWGLASLKVSRLDAFFALSTVGFLTPQILELFRRERVARTSSPVLRPVAQLTFGALVLTMGMPVFARNLTCIDVHATTVPEAEAMQYVQTHRLSGRMLTFFDWGEYTIWHMPPGLRVSMDGRRETVYTNATVDAHLDMYLGMESGLAYFNRVAPDYVWLPGALPVTGTLEQSGAWVPVYRGPQSVLLVRTASALASRTAPVATAPASCRCFPGP
jgi:hypothetical protein